MTHTCFCRLAWGLAAVILAGGQTPSGHWLVYQGGHGPGYGKHVVLISGDEEYRSEEALPQLAAILAERHGFRCTVLFAIDPDTGEINPENTHNIPGLAVLDTADLMIIATRFRELPDEQMKHIDDYVQSGRPIIGLRTATHAFRYAEDSTSRYRRYDFRSREWDGGFGRQVLGETWVGHHGRHAVQSTRGVIAPGRRNRPIVRGCNEIWGPTDVYTVDLSQCASCEVLVYGQVLQGMNPADQPVRGESVRKTSHGEERKRPNDPMMPVAWTKRFTGRNGISSRIFTTTMGAAVDLQNEGVRRLIVNAVYWALGMEDRIKECADVRLVGDYHPAFFGFGQHKRGLRPADLRSGSGAAPAQKPADKQSR